jgi:iron complex transport system substrate-binding protein
VLIGCGANPSGSPREPERLAPGRIISLVPSLTETLFAVGAGAQVVGVGTFDRYPPQVTKLPRVGGLVDPNTERILSLRPDLVVTYGSQAELEGILRKAGIATFSYRHGGIAGTIEAIRELGKVTGHEAQAATVASRIEQRLAAVRAKVKGRPRPRTLLVIDRQPRTLRDVYVSGGRGFLHEMLEIAGGTNVFADIDRESAQPSTETLLTRAPDVILEVRASAPTNMNAELAAWNALPSVPAVKTRRVLILSGDYLVDPGPRIAQGVEAMARVLHPEAFK